MSSYVVWETDNITLTTEMHSELDMCKEMLMILITVFDFRGRAWLALYT